MSSYTEVMEEAMNTEALRAFDDILEEAAESYGEAYGEDVELTYQGPMGHTFAGPAAGQTVSNHSKYQLEGEHGWSINLRVDVVDNPYHVDEIVEDGDVLNLSKFADAVRDFDPEETRSRIAKLTIEDNGHDYSEEEKDRWFCFNQHVEDVLEPDKAMTKNEVDYLYFFDLKDTQS
ncbi:MAG: hypothetical protein ABEI58_04365 [Candidatus Nanohaloarchaea archaeon]